MYVICCNFHFSPPTPLSFSPLGDIPIVPLNFAMISLEGSFNRDTVEGCVKETLLYLSRSISIKKNVEFIFKGIGVLMIRDGRVKMRFLKDFLFKMDGSGALAKALANVNYCFPSPNPSPHYRSESSVRVSLLRKIQVDIF